eukprot:8019432-Pyramimonas_sp.AAC.1
MPPALSTSGWHRICTPPNMDIASASASIESAGRENSTVRNGGSPAAVAFAVPAAAFRRDRKDCACKVVCSAVGAATASSALAAVPGAAAA